MRLLAHFVIHILVATALFLVLVFAAFFLWRVTAWLETQGFPNEFTLVCHTLAYAVFAADVLSFSFFVVVRAAMLTREIWITRHEGEGL